MQNKNWKILSVIEKCMLNLHSINTRYVFSNSVQCCQIENLSQIMTTILEKIDNFLNRQNSKLKIKILKLW